VEKAFKEWKRPEDVSISMEYGNTGSRMLLQGVPLDPSFIQFLLQDLRFVDYLSLHLGSTECLTNEGGMAKATREILEVHGRNVDKIVDTWRKCHYFLKDKEVGLEPLPGKVLPMVNLKLQDSHDSPSPTQTPFAPNTIYTKKEVSKLVIDTVQQVSSEFLGNDVSKRAFWLDAGCGNGSLLQEMPENKRLGVDIVDNETLSDMQEADFLRDVSRDWLLDKCTNFSPNSPLFVVSNPPFAQDSRGNYRPIVQFIQHSFENLHATVVTVIVPTKFARQRVMESYGMNLTCTDILARMNLPDHAFYDPSTMETKHIPSTLLIIVPTKTGTTRQTGEDPPSSHFRIRVEGSRNKSHFRNISTQSMETSVRLAMIEHWGIHNDVIAKQDQYALPVMTISAELTKQGKGKLKQAVLDLWLQLNPKRPLSLVNCQSRHPAIQPPHSLGWVTTSCKSNVAAAMIESCGIELGKGTVNDEPSTSSGTEQSHPTLAVNAMCGEGTLEIEASASVRPFFWLAGDSSLQALLDAKQRIASLQNININSVVYDFVQWDCQHLPIRDGTVDAYLADLPIAGGTGKSNKTKEHYKPTSGKDEESSNNLNYRAAIQESLRVMLSGTGHGSFVSVDANSLKHGMLSFQSYWMPVLEQSKMTLGGLPGIFFCVARRTSTTKNVSMWLRDHGTDHSRKLLDVAREACSKYSFDQNSWEIVMADDLNPFDFVTTVALVDIFHSESLDDSRISHCYQVTFHPLVSNQQSKELESDIRAALVKKPVAPEQVLR
jgi:hypothetical protein